DRGYFLIRAGDLERADSLLALAQRTGTPGDRYDAAWWRVIALRYAGRPRAAAHLAPFAISPAAREGSAPALAGLALAHSLFEAGDLEAADRIFAPAGMHSPAFQRSHPGLAARHRAWGLAQRASVAAAQGDLPMLQALEESVTVHAQASGFGRDRHLPSYVR